MTEGAITAVDAWRTRLAASRAALLRALEGVTERDFAAAFDGDRSLVHVLAELAVAERMAVARARGDEREARVPDRPLAPQVIHDLAGARYTTERLLADAAAAGEASDRLAALVDGIVDREQAVAARLAARARE
ncbi:MAG: hypothetical protein WEB13_05990 [Dehalococcoidia bacterium]